MNRNHVIPFLLLGLFLTGCGAVSPKPASLISAGAIHDEAMDETPVRIAMATDLHYQPEISDAASSLVPQMKYIDPLTDCLLDQVGEWQPDVLLLCGDLTNNGHQKEHEALIQKLDQAREQGLQILVIPGNHDLKNTTGEAFARLYQNYGYGASALRDEESFSYVSQVTEQLWLLMLDTNWTDGYGGVGHGTLAWVEQVLKEAENAGARVIAASHHNLLGHSSSQYNKQYSFENKKELLQLLKQYQVPLNISGHLHKQHVSRDSSGTYDFYEIAGGMLAEYPNLYSQFTVAPASGNISYQSKALDVDGWAALKGYQDKELLHFSDYSRECRRQNAAGLVGGMLSSMDITGDELARLTKYWTDISMDASDGTIQTSRKDYLSADEYRLWQQHQNRSKYSEWLDFLLEKKEGVDSHSLLIKY